VYFGRELLDTHGADYRPERKLQVHTLVDGRQQELAGECRLEKLLPGGDDS
jgi:hypothetical protein